MPGPVADGGRILIRLEGQDTNLSEVLAKVQASMNQAVKTSDIFVTAIDRNNAHLARSQAEAIKVAQAYLRLSELTGNAANGQEKLAKVLANTTIRNATFVQGLNSLQASLNNTANAQKATGNAFFETAKAAASTAEKVELLRGKLNTLIPGTKEYAQVARQVIQAEQQLAKEAQRTADALAKRAAADKKVADAAKARNDRKAAADAQALSKSTLDLALATANLSGKVVILRNHLATLQQGTVAYNQTAIRLANAEKALTTETDKLAAAQKRAAAAKANAKSAGDSLLSGLQRLSGAYFAITNSASLFTDAISKANQFEKTDATFRALSITQEEYVKNLEAAKQQQQLYGKSLQENQEDLSGFIFTARNAKVPVQDLLNLGRKLAVLDPAQGIRGASIAIRELFSGEITSLARRFEIPREVLNGINALGTGAEKVAALNERLSQMGISEEILTNQTQLAAIEFDKLNGAATDALTGIGLLITSETVPAVQTLTYYLSQVLPAMQTLTGAGDKEVALTSRIYDATDSVQAFNVKIQETNAIITQQFGAWPKFFQSLGLIPQFDLMTDAQYRFVTGLVNTGVKFDEAAQRGIVLKDTLETIDKAMLGLDHTFASTVGFASYKVAVEQALATGAAGADVVAIYTQLLSEHKISVDQATAAIFAYTEAINGAKTLTEQDIIVRDNWKDENVSATSAADALTEEIKENTKETVLNQFQTEALKIAQEKLYDSLLQASKGYQSADEFATYLQARFGYLHDEAIKLANAIFAVRQATDNLAGKKTPSGPPIGTPGYSRPLTAAEGRATSKAVSDMKALEQAQRDYAYATADAAGQLAILRGELDKLNPGTAAYVNKQKEIALLEKSIAKSGSGAKAVKFSENEKLNNQLLAQEDKYEDKLEDAAREHTQNLLDINAEYYKKLKEQQEKNEVSKRRGRADFYSNNVIEGVDTTKFAADYEAAFQRAQEIAQEGNAQLADEYLKLRQQQIEELRALEQERAEVIANEDLSEEQKAAALEYLEGRKKLIEDAQKEELDLLLKNGDAINNELNERLTEEEKRYEENRAKIILADDRATEKILINSERRKKTTAEENKLLEEQKKLYEEKYGASPTTTGVAPVPTSSNQIANQQAPESSTVTQLDVWNVRDQGVLDLMGAWQLSLDSRLVETIAAVNEAKLTITAAVGKVESAVHRLRGTNNNMVTTN